MSITGIVLAGGESSRMNYNDKGLIELNGKPCILHVIHALERCVDKVIIIANNKQYKAFGYDVFPDIYLKKGPLGGIYTGLVNSVSEKNIVVGCDMPQVKPEIFSKLIEQSMDYDITVPVVEGKYQPLCAVYSKTLTQKINTSIKNERLKLRFLIDEVQTKTVTDHALNSDLFFNMNTPDELETLKHKTCG